MSGITGRIGGSPDFIPDDADAAPGPGADELADRAEARLSGDDGSMADPGVRLGLGGRIVLPGGLPSGGGAGGAAGALDLAASARDLSASAGASARGTIGIGSGDPSDRATISLGLDATALGRLDPGGLDQIGSVLSQGGQVFSKTQDLYNQAQTLMQSITTSPEVARFKELVLASTTRQLTASEISEAQGLAKTIQGKMQQATDVLGRMGPLLGDVNGILDKMGDGALTAKAGLTAGIFVEETVGARTPTLTIGDSRFDASFTAHLMQATPLPDAARTQLSALDQLVQLNSSAIAVRGYVNVTVGAIDQLKQTIDGLNQDLGQLGQSIAGASNTVGAVANNPQATFANAQQYAGQAAAAALKLSSDGNAVSSRADQLSKQLDVKVESGVEIDQPTAPTGVGIDEIAARWRWDPSQSFELAVEAYVDHAAGWLGGTSSRLAFDPSTGKLNPAGTTSENVYSSFFPRTFGTDVGVSMGRDTTTRADIMAGIGTDGQAVSAHLGYVQQLGQRVVLRLGVVDPDVTRTTDHTLIPRAGIDLNLGPDSRPDAVTLGLDAGAAITFGNGQSPQISGGDANLGLTIRFP
jgi:hypothetical protein